MFLYDSFIVPIEKIMETLLVFFHSTTGSYGVSIILLSLVITVITLPLFWVAENIQGRDRKKKAEMKPALDELKDVENRQERYFYTQRVYKQYGYHPVHSLGSLLGLLIQIPFFIAAFQMLGHFGAFEGIAFGPIKNLFAPDAIWHGVNVLPILMTLINLVASAWYLTNADKNEKLQQYFIAGLFLVLLYDQPAALVLYWTLNNFFSIGKNWLFGYKPTISFKRSTFALDNPTVQRLVFCSFVFIAVATVARKTAGGWLFNCFAHDTTVILAGILLVYFAIALYLKPEKSKYEKRLCFLMPPIWVILGILAVKAGGSTLLALEIIGTAPLFFTTKHAFAYQLKYAKADIGQVVGFAARNQLLVLLLTGVIILHLCVASKSKEAAAILAALNVFLTGGVLLYRWDALKRGYGSALLLISIGGLWVLGAVLAAVLGFHIDIQMERPEVILMLLALLVAHAILMGFVLLWKNNSFKSELAYFNATPKGKPRAPFIEFLLFVFVTFLATPLYIYYSSPPDFGGTGVEVATSIGTAIAVFSLIYFAVYWLLGDYRTILVKLTAASLFMFLLFGYIYQKNFGIMRNGIFVNESVLRVNSTIIAVDLIAIFAIFVFTFRYYARVRQYLLVVLMVIVSFQAFNVYQFVSDCRVVMAEQMGKGSHRDVTDKLGREVETDAEAQLSQCLALSKDKQNIVVFVFDGFRAPDLNEMIEENPHYRSMLEGFTWYRNTVSIGSFTFPSASALYGGHAYSVAEINRRNTLTFGEARAESVLKHHKYFQDLGYDVCYSYLLPYFGQRDKLIAQGANIIPRDCLREYIKGHIGDHISEDGRKILRGEVAAGNEPLNGHALRHFTCFKLSPYSYKAMFYRCCQGKNRWLGADERYIRDMALKKYSWRYTRAESTFTALRNLPRATSEKPTLLFIWDSTSCALNFMNEQGSGPDIDKMVSGEHKGCGVDEVKHTIDYLLRSVAAFAQRLKAEGCYDNTTILLASDHGRTSGKRGQSWHSQAIYPLLMVKENNQRGPLKISNKLMSNADIFAITSAVASGTSADVIPNPLKHNGNRKLFYWATVHGNWDILKKRFVDIDFGIEVTGNVYDEDQWRKVDYETYVRENVAMQPLRRTKHIADKGDDKTTIR